MAGAVRVGPAGHAGARRGARHRADADVPALVQGRQAGHLDRAVPDAVRLGDDEPLVVKVPVLVEPAGRAVALNQAILVLERNGPAEGRPLVDSITASRIASMKELRPPSAGRSEIRILFVFDPWRSAVLLVAGDKSGQWERWYRTAIPRAEQLYEDYLAEREKEVGK